MADADDATPLRGASADDIELTEKDREQLIEALATEFPTNVDADLVLDRLGFPRWRAPDFETDRRDAWRKVFADLDRGIVPAPYRGLLGASGPVRPWQGVFNELSRKYRLDRPAVGPPGPPGPTQPPPPGAAEMPARLAVEVMGVDHRRDDGFAFHNLRMVRAVERRMGHVVAHTSVGPAERNGALRPHILHICAELAGRDLVFGESGERIAVPVAELADRLTGPLMWGVLLNFSHSADVAEAFRGVARTVVAHRGHLDHHCAVQFVWHTYFFVPRDRSIGLAARAAANLLANHPDLVCPSIQDNLVVLGDEGGAPVTGPGRDGRAAQPAPPARSDIPLNQTDLDIVVRTVSTSFRNPNDVRRLLVLIEYPRIGELPDDLTALWVVVFRQLDSGIVATPYRNLISHALGCYPYNRSLLSVAGRYGVEPGPPWEEDRAG